ncbi:MAG: 5'-nucleotidase, lipoprotein e(P4) family [Pyrinomonadaceae bacterium]
MSKGKLSAFFAALLIASVAATFIATRSFALQTPPADNEHQTGAVLWYQTAAENRALAYQAFELAKLRLDAQLKPCKKSRKKLPCAIVTDVDETILDNSPNQAFLIKNRRSFNPTDWQNWCNLEAAKPLPGAIEFFNYAVNKGFKPFYVTNRDAAQKTVTGNNLRKAGFPDVTDETLMVRADTSSKEARRQAIAQKYRIVMLLGDNLNDFAQAFERKSIADRSAAVDAAKADFGSRFIMLPNPMYGDWESAIYDYNFKRTEEAKAVIRQTLLQSY